MRRLVFAFACLLSTAATAAPHYSVTILQTPGGAAMEAFGLNNRGDVVGGAQDGFYQAYLRHADGSYEALGGLGGNRATASAISDNGTIAGLGRTGTTSVTSTPFVRYGGGPLTPIALPPHGDSAGAHGVNDTGTVVGDYLARAEDGWPTTQGFRWNQATGFQVLESVAGQPNTAIYGINASGDAVGEAFYFDQTAFRWNADGSVLVLDKVPTLPGMFDNFSYANDINDAGLIAGSTLYYTASEMVGQMATWGSDGHLLRTASLDGWTSYYGNAINENGDVVGDAVRPFIDDNGWYLSDETTAVLWLAGEGLVDLNTLIDQPGLKLEGTRSINDRGQIIAYGLRDGVRFDVLLTPGGQGVPEPASWAMMIAGFALAGAAMRSRRGGLRDHGVFATRAG